MDDEYYSDPAEELQDDISNGIQNAQDAAQTAKNAYDRFNDLKSGEHGGNGNSHSGADKNAGKGAKEAGKGAGKDAAKEGAKEAGKDTAKEGVKEGAKKAAETGARAAGDAATGGALEIVLAVLNIGQKAVTTVRNAGEEEEKKSHPLFWLCFFLFGGPIFVLMFFMTILILNLNPGSVETYRHSNFDLTKELDDKTPLTDRADNVKGFMSDNTEDDEIKEYSYPYPLQAGIKQYIYNDSQANEAIVEKDAKNNPDDENAMNELVAKLKRNLKPLNSFKLSLHNHATHRWLDYTRNYKTTNYEGIIHHDGDRFPRIRKREYREMRTLESLCSNPYPYDLQIDEIPSGQPVDCYPAIGNVMIIGKELGYGDGVRYNPKYNDVNYAEFLSVFSQAHAFNWENCEFVEYLLKINGLDKEGNDLYVDGTNAVDCFFEMDVPSWVAIYELTVPIYDDEGHEVDSKHFYEEISYGSVDELSESPDYINMEGYEVPWVAWFATIKMKPFGLRNLYKFITYEDEETGEIITTRSDDLNELMYFHVNRDILDYSEKYIRTYERMERDKRKGNLGPSYVKDRDEHSTIYEELLKDEELIKRHQEGKGRSAWFYIEDPYNLKKRTDEGIFGEEQEEYKLPENVKKEASQWVSKGGFTKEQIDDYINNKIPNATPAQKEVVRWAMMAVDNIPYWYGGHADAKGFEGNNFGAPHSADAKGRTAKGLDCSGFVHWVYWTATGKSTPGTTAAYPGNYTAVSEPQIGDLGFKKTPGASNNHVGIYIGNGQWIHCSGMPRNRVVCDKGNPGFTVFASGARWQ